MKKLTGMLVLTVMATIAVAGEMENTALSGNLSGLKFAAVEGIELPAPKPEAVKSSKEASSAAWVNAVKNEYAALVKVNRTNTLPAAALSELPEAVAKRIEYEDELFSGDQDYPGAVTSKLVIQRKTAYVVEVGYDMAMTTRIYDESGKMIASGSFKGHQGVWSWGKPVEHDIHPHHWAK
jgi:hypothetical protein